MTGKIALVGGDEFRSSCIDMDAALVEITGVQHPNVLIVPTAAVERPSLAAKNGIQHFQALGAAAEPLMALKPEDANNPALMSAVDSADMIYLTGGNPAHLLNVLSGSLLLNKMRQALHRGAILAGSSAGAMVMGGRMRFRQWGDALAIVPNVVVFPHHERSDPNTTASDLSGVLRSDEVVLGIDGATGCISGTDGWRVLGSGGVTLYHNGGWQRFESGDTFALPS